MSDSFPFLDGDDIARELRASQDPDGSWRPHHVIEALPLQHIDSFSRLRTSDPGYRFDAQLTYDVDADLWDEDDNATGSIVHSSTDRMATLTAAAGDASGTNKVILQSHYHAPYTPGRGQLAFITFSMGAAAPVAGGYRRAGYWDGSNGIYLEQSNSAVSLNLASDTTSGDVSVDQDDWNLDKLDGTGISGKTLDLSKTLILVIQLQALYVGRVVVGLDIDGELVPVHQFLHANTISDPYIQQASLPVRYEVEADNTASAITMEAICASVISEGGVDLADIPGRPFVSYGTVDNAADNTVLCLIRPKATFNSNNQNALVIPLELDVTVEGAGCWIELRRNVTIGVGTFTDVDTLSTVEESYAGNAGTDPTTTDGTGTLVDKFYVAASQQAKGNRQGGLLGKVLLVYSHLLTTADNLAIIADGGGTSEVRASLKWKEIR